MAQGPYRASLCPRPLDQGQREGGEEEVETSEALALLIGCAGISNQGTKQAGCPGEARGLGLLLPPSPETFAAITGIGVLTVLRIPGYGFLRFSEGQPCDRGSSDYFLLPFYR